MTAILAAFVRVVDAIMRVVRAVIAVLVNGQASHDPRGCVLPSGSSRPERSDGRA